MVPRSNRRAGRGATGLSLDPTAAAAAARKGTFSEGEKTTEGRDTSAPPPASSAAAAVYSREAARNSSLLSLYEAQSVEHVAGDQYGGGGDGGGGDGGGGGGGDGIGRDNSGSYLDGDGEDGSGGGGAVSSGGALLDRGGSVSGLYGLVTPSEWHQEGGTVNCSTARAARFSNSRGRQTTLAGVAAVEGGGDDYPWSDERRTLWSRGSGDGGGATTEGGQNGGNVSQQRRRRQQRENEAAMDGISDGIFHDEDREFSTTITGSTGTGAFLAEGDEQRHYRVGLTLPQPSPRKRSSTERRREHLDHPTSTTPTPAGTNKLLGAATHVPIAPRYPDEEGSDFGGNVGPDDGGVGGGGGGGLGGGGLGGGRFSLWSSSDDDDASVMDVYVDNAGEDGHYDIHGSAGEVLRAGEAAGATLDGGGEDGRFFPSGTGSARGGYEAPEGVFLPVATTTASRSPFFDAATSSADKVRFFYLRSGAFLLYHPFFYIIARFNAAKR